jgi:hypothetical protein
MDLKVIESLIEKDIEVCGFIFDKTVIYIDSVGDENSCQHSKYQEVIFHTHPKKGKGYPSIEDILKIVKKRKTDLPKLSIIFTGWGVWELSCNKKVEIKEDEIRKIYSPYLDSIYFKTEKGRKLQNEDYVFKKIKDLVDGINKNLKCELSIIFSSWKEVGETYKLN